MILDFKNLFEAIVALLVGSATFITGMNMMSSGLKKSTGKGLKRLFKKIQNKSFAGLGIGAAVTALIQSSAATSVMVIGFINAGVMTICQGLSIIMGAYIGTTVTGLLVSLSSFNISTYFFILAFIGVVMMFFKSKLIKNIGEIFCGLGLLFFGLEVMKGAFGAEQIHNFCETLFQKISFPLLLLLIGAIFTALVQSSSATTGIVIVMVASNSMPFESALYVALGATIGTVITTIIATIGGTPNAKRTGLMALILRIFCALIAVSIVWPLQSQISDLLLNMFAGNNQLAVAMFVVIYNVVFMLLSLPLVKTMEKISIKLVKDKQQEKMKKNIHYIDDKLLNTPSIAMMQVKKEIENMALLSRENFILGYNMVMNQDLQLAKELEDREDAIDYINNRVTDFLINLSHKVDIDDEKIIGAYFHVINDIERIGDHASNFLDMAQEMKDSELKFSEIAHKEFESMYTIIVEMFDMSMKLFENNETFDLTRLHELENETDDLKTNLSAAHFERITKNECKVELSPYYSSFISELERIADHLTNVGYSIVNPTGDEI